MKDRIRANKVFGTFVGGAVSLFFGAEMVLVIQFLMSLGIDINMRFVYPLVWGVAVVLFIVIKKKITKSNRDGLVKYFFFAVITSVAVVLIFITITISIIRIPFINEYIVINVQTKTGAVIMTIALNFYFVLLILVFSGSFALILKPKIHYIKYISKKVREIEHSGFGETLNVKYNDELSELSMCINSMSLALWEKQENEKREEENKNRLIADISHDIRTPLTSIIGYVDLLEKNGFHDKEKFNQYIEVVGRRLNSLKSMLDQLFEFTKLNQSDTPLSIQKVDLISLLSYVEFEYGNIYRRLGYKWSMEVTDTEIYLELDVEKFMRAMENLLENAKKHSMPNTEIRMKVLREHDSVKIQLSNETELVNQDDIEKMFERFFRLDKSRSIGSGNNTGLGLPITKKIIELHGGKLLAKLQDSRITFEVSMPYVYTK